MQIKKEFWGVTRQGENASKYMLTNKNGMEVVLSDFGALILAIRLPVKGEMRDVCLGFDTVEQYYDNGPGFGAYVGRNGNRIGGAKVMLDGVTYELEKNDNGNNLHSGSNRSYYQFYQSAVSSADDAMWVEFTRVSPHLEQGFPGNLEQTVAYTLTDDNELVIRYHMVADRKTVINPTNHCYFNLMGHKGGYVGEHIMTLTAEHFLPTDDELIPTGEVRSVAGTPFDFRQPHKVGERIDDSYGSIQQGGGYDHNFCYPNDGRQKLLGSLESPDGAVTMTVSSDLCGMQVYSGNFLQGEAGKDGAVYDRRSGICFETQGYPNACNTHGFPTTVFAAGQSFDSKTVYGFRF